MPTKTKGVADSDAHLFCPRLIGNIVQVTLRVRGLVVNGGRYATLSHCLHTENGFECAGRAHHVPGHGFR